MNYTNEQLYDFVKESNAIENIFRDPTQEEIDELERFINLDFITIDDLKKFVSIYQPDAVLRDRMGLNVKVGDYIAPSGGWKIIEQLGNLFSDIPYLNKDILPIEIHIRYEKIHPFTDCNGRSGRALWAWANKDIKGGFLKNFYFQILNTMHVKS